MRRCGQWFFNALIGLALVAAYCLIVAGWLIVKTVGNLQFAICNRKLCAGPSEAYFLSPQVQRQLRLPHHLSAR